MKKILFVMLVLMGAGTAHSQIPPEALKKSKNFLNCKISLMAINEKLKQDKKYEQALDSLTHALSGVKIENPPDYDSLVKILTRFPRAVEEISSQIESIDISLYLSQPSSEAAKNLTNTAFMLLVQGYREYYETIKQQQQQKLETIVSGFLKSATPIEPKPEPPLPRKPVSAGFFSLDHLNFWVLLSFIFPILLFLNARKLFKSSRKKIDREATTGSKYGDTLYMPEAGLTPEERRRLDKAVAESGKLSELVESIQELQRKVSDLEAGSTAKPQSAYRQLMNTEDAGQDIFYMSGPVNNYFPNTAKSLTKDFTVYKFIVKPNKQEAEFEVHTAGAPVKEVVSMVESYIKPACDAENTPSFNVKNIITIAPGLATLEGDKWVIKNKAVIRYE